MAADLVLQIASNNLSPVEGDEVVARAKLRNFGPDDCTDIVGAVHFNTYEFVEWGTLNASSGEFTPGDPPDAWNAAEEEDHFTFAVARIAKNTSLPTIGLKLRAMAAVDARPRINGSAKGTQSDPNSKNNQNVLAQSTLP